MVMMTNVLKKATRDLRKIRVKKIHYILASVVVILIFSYSILGFTLSSPPYKLEYAIQTISESDNILNINLKISNLKNRDRLELYKGKANSFDYSFHGLRESSKTTLNEENQYVVIDNLDCDSIVLSYKVKIGQLAKHGHRGEIYKDSLVFEGDDVLILPADAYVYSDTEIKKNISQINIYVKSKTGWTGAIPFERKGLYDENTVTSVIEYPTWLDIYHLNKACFSLGKFNKEQITSKYGVVDLYVDTSINNTRLTETKDGLKSIFIYYEGLFGKGLPKFSITLLEKSPDNSVGILGGSSSETLGTTFDPRNKRDWELISHRIFHAFFETNVKSPQIFSPPNLWFYEGLATYYENVAAGFLPNNFKKSLNIDTKENFDSLFRKYVYMYFKDPKIKEIIPINEEKYVDSGGKTEFLHYTLAPLIIKAIEDKSLNKFKQPNRTLKYILKEYGNKPFDIKDILKNSIGDEGDGFYNSYIFANNVLPLWQRTPKIENSSKVIQELNDFEYLLYTWFRNEIENYPLNVLKEDTLAVSLNKAKEQNIHFSDHNTETLVLDLSPTLYSLLMQNTLSTKTSDSHITKPR